MDEDKRYVRLGVFVVVTLSLLAAVLFLLGGRKLFQPTFTFETYFNQSVAGLELGAPVRFRGVPLGQVTEIVTAAAVYEPARRWRSAVTTSWSEGRSASARRPRRCSRMRWRW